MRRLRFSLLGLVMIAGCASARGGAGAYVDSAFDFSRVRSVYLETPIQLTVRGSEGIGNRDLERVTEQELREFFRRELGWTSASTVAEAGLAAAFELTHWEEDASGSRVGGSLELTRPDGVVIFRARTVYPSQFGVGAPGSPRELLPDLLRELLEPVDEGG